MSRTLVLSGIVIIGMGILLAGQAQSQLGSKGQVALQGSTPGVSQSGHANISGRLTAGNVHSTGLLNIGPTYSPGIGAAKLVVGDPASTGFEGSYMYASAAGEPFYGYVAGAHSAWTMIDGSDGNKWKLNNNGVKLTVQTDGKVGIGTTSPLTPVHIVAPASTVTRGDLSVVHGTDVTSYNPGHIGIMGHSNSSGSNYSVAGTFFSNTTSGDSFGISSYGYTTGPTAYGIYSEAAGPGTKYAGFFNGLIHATSSSAGVKSFLIDHPLDPENKLLEHSSVESDQRMNIYRGEVRTNASGYAIVSVPDWFLALNENIQYQLTVVADEGQTDFVQTMVSKRMNQSGQFEIRTSQGNVTVNWQVSGERHDPTSEHIPLIVERDKPASMKGKYMVPEAYGLKQDRAMHKGPMKADWAQTAQRGK